MAQMEGVASQDEVNQEEEAVQLVQEQIETKPQNDKPKVKPVKFNFELRETTPVNSESDTDDADPENDGLPDPMIGREDEIVKVFEEDGDGNQVENHRKTYKLTPVVERIGCFINIDEKYFNKKAIM